MRNLIRYQKYSRKEVHDIFSPNTNFIPGTGTWGAQGIIRVPETKCDYVFFVTYGQVQADHVFDENIDENGIFTWQSQPHQNFKSQQILDLINHDHRTDNIHLFLRTDKNSDYTYLGLLAYVEHDNQRENPVHFKWQILDFDSLKVNETIKKMEKDTNIDALENLDVKKFKLVLRDLEEVNYVDYKRKGTDTQNFYSNKNINFEENDKKNKCLGDKGEDIVVEYEKNNLIKEGRTDLAENVVAVRNIAGNAERFDVISYDKEGNEKFIEVKTTKGGLTSTFHISEKEVKFSYDYGKKYYLYRVYNFDTTTMSADLKIIKGPIERNKLKPTNYICKIGIN